MGEIYSDEFKQKVCDLSRRIEAKIEDVRRTGILNGSQREAQADAKLRDLENVAFLRGGTAKIGELAADLEILRLTMERWLARLDKASEHPPPRRTGGGGYGDASGK